MLASGIFGTVTRLGDDRVWLEVAPGVEVEAMRAAISGVDEKAAADGDTPGAVRDTDAATSRLRSSA